MPPANAAASIALANVIDPVASPGVRAGSCEQRGAVGGARPDASTANTPWARTRQPFPTTAQLQCFTRNQT